MGNRVQMSKSVQSFDRKTDKTLGKPRHGGRITHEGILKVHRGCELDSSRSGGSPVAESCVDGIELGLNTKWIIS